jgi:hypothetical protein
MEDPTLLLRGASTGTKRQTRTRSGEIASRHTFDGFYI